MERQANLKESAFGQILTRNNKTIRDDRALAIVEDAELEYGRKIENLERDLKILNRKRFDLLDLSPGNALSLTPEKFDPAMFVEKDMEYGVQIREMEIRLEIAKKKYNELFGTTATATAAPQEN